MQIALNLLLNTTLLLSISIIFNQYYLKLHRQTIWHRIIGGIVLGVAGIAIVTIAIRLPTTQCCSYADRIHLPRSPPAQLQRTG